MAYSRNLTRIRDKYDKRSLISASMLDSCLIFDLADGGSLVCSRICANLKSSEILGKTIFDIMSSKEAEFLFSYCKGYTDRPAAVKTNFGIAILYPHLVPATSCCVLSFPAVGGSEYCIALMRSGKKLLLSDEAQGALKRRKLLKDECIEQCNILMENTAAVFDGSDATLENDGMTEAVVDRIYDISRYASCHAGVVCGDPLNSAVEFDNPLFICFMLILLFTARRVSARTDSGVVVEQTQYGAYITVSFAGLKGVRLDSLEEMVACRRIADRRNLLFEVMAGDNVVHITFSPVRREWSYLELKSPECNDGERRV